MPREYCYFTIDDYEITKDGEVINRHTGRHVKPQKNGKGYLRVSIGGKLQFVHRLVAEKFIPNPQCLPQVNHIDGNKLNNSVENLEWVTNQQNRDHALKNGLHTTGENCPWAKLRKSDVDFIREHPEFSAKLYAEIYDVGERYIRALKHGKGWKY